MFIVLSLILLWIALGVIGGAVLTVSIHHRYSNGAAPDNGDRIFFLFLILGGPATALVALDEIWSIFKNRIRLPKLFNPFRFVLILTDWPIMLYEWYMKRREIKSK